MQHQRNKENKSQKLEEKAQNLNKAASEVYPINNEEERKGYRLKILRNFLYGSGISYVILSIIIIILNFYENKIMSTELIVLVTFLGSSITTIIGVIAGTSIDK